jgi:hypothetical protein
VAKIADYKSGTVMNSVEHRSNFPPELIRLYQAKQAKEADAADALWKMQQEATEHGIVAICGKLRSADGRAILPQLSKALFSINEPL